MHTAEAKVITNIIWGVFEVPSTMIIQGIRDDNKCNYPHEALHEFPFSFACDSPVFIIPMQLFKPIH